MKLTLDSMQCPNYDEAWIISKGTVVCLKAMSLPPYHTQASTAAGEDQ